MCQTRWKAWEGDETLRLDFPPSWHIDSFDILKATPVTQEVLRTALDRPLGIPPLEERFSKRGTVAVAVEDLTRPLYIGEVLKLLIGRLLYLGFRDEDFRIILSIGAHHPMLRPEQMRKLGDEIVKRFAIENHHPYLNLKDCGVSQWGTPVHLNRTFLEADYRIVLGSVLPHPYTGFSGGAKLVVPGLAGIDTIEMTHRSAVVGVQGGFNNPETNQVRAEIESIVEKIGIDCSVHLVVGRQRAMVGCVVGDLIKAHRECVRIARSLYSTPGPSESVDVVVLNAYPKDTEMLQIGNALNMFRDSSAVDRVLKKNGTVVVLAACSHGRGHHSLHQPGGKVYRPPVQRVSQIGERELCLLSVGANIHDFHGSFWHGYKLFTEWTDLRDHLQTKHGNRSRVAVFHAAPLQLLAT